MSLIVELLCSLGENFMSGGMLVLFSKFLFLITWTVLFFFFFPPTSYCFSTKLSSTLFSVITSVCLYGLQIFTVLLHCYAVCWLVCFSYLATLIFFSLCSTIMSFFCFSIKYFQLFLPLSRKGVLWRKMILQISIIRTDHQRSLLKVANVLPVYILKPFSYKLSLVWLWFVTLIHYYWFCHLQQSSSTECSFPSCFLRCIRLDWITHIGFHEMLTWMAYPLLNAGEKWFVASFSQGIQQRHQHI